MEEKLLTARINDTAAICDKTDKPRFLGFLSAEQAVLADKLLEKRHINYGFFGGYPEAQRVMLGCFPQWLSEPEYPITAVSFTYRALKPIRHRDVLGTVMSLGLTREAVGDILTEDGRAVVFVTSEVADYIVAQTEKIGGTGVKAEIGFKGALPAGDTLTELSGTVASERLDCVVSVLAASSRTAAAELIENGLVSINSQVCERITRAVSDGDIISVRGKGKFIIEALTERTRKNRLVLKYKKYT